MKKYLFYIFFVLLLFTCKAQMFKIVPPVKNNNNICQYVINKDTLTVSEKQMFVCLDWRKNTVKSLYSFEEVNFFDTKLFYFPKTQTAYLFAEEKSPLKKGCLVFRIQNNQIIQMRNFQVAAYTSENNQRMNYNSILPHISIVNAGGRTLLTFECNLIVLNPDTDNERIENTKGVYGLITSDAVEIRKH